MFLHRIIQSTYTAQLCQSTVKVTESRWLEKTFEIIKSSHKPNTAKSTSLIQPLSPGIVMPKCGKKLKWNKKIPRGVMYDTQYFQEPENLTTDMFSIWKCKDHQMLLPSLRLYLTLSSLPVNNPKNKTLNRTKNGGIFYSTKQMWTGEKSNCKMKFRFKYCQNGYCSYKCSCNTFFKKTAQSQ